MSCARTVYYNIILRRRGMWWCRINNYSQRRTVRRGCGPDTSPAQGLKNCDLLLLFYTTVVYIWEGMVTRCERRSEVNIIYIYIYVRNLRTTITTACRLLAHSLTHSLGQLN